MAEKIRVLYAEDDFRDADLIAEHIKRNAPNFDLEVVGRGETFLARLEETDFDLLLLDYRLPDMTGIDILRALNQRSERPPAIMITAYGDEESILQCLRLGASDYIPKKGDYISRLPELFKKAYEEEQERNDFLQRAGLSQNYVLYVEHHAMDIDLTLKHFADRAPRVTIQTVGTCREALELLRQGVDIDLVLTDLRMPDMSGLVFLKEARSLDIAIPFIVITGKGDEETAVAALKMGAYDYIVKGERYLDQLPRAVDHAIGHYRLIQMNQKLNEELKEMNVVLQENVHQRVEELEESQRRFRTFFDDSPVGNVMTDKEGRLLQTNPVIRNLLGYSEEEIQRLTLLDIIYPDDRAESETCFRQLLDGSQRQFRCEKRLISKTGEPICCRMAVSSVQNDRGEFEWAMGAIEDIRGQKDLERQLLQSQKMEAVGRLTGGIAHDFNNILTAIIGHSDVLLLDHGPADPGYQHMVTIKDAAQRAAGLIRQLLAFSRRQILEPVTLDLNRMLENLKNLVPRLIGEDVLYSFDLSQDLKPIKADPSMVEQVILNLIVNARDAMANGGQLTLATENQFLDQAFCHQHRDLKPGDHVVISVTDTGTGILEEVADHMFEPFFTTKPDGTGLGLSTVYGIVKQLDGDIFALSEPGLGTTFKIYFPALSETTVPAPHSVKSEGSAVPQGRETILVLEDDPTLLNLSQHLLSKLGYSVLTAGNSQEAMACSHEHGAGINLLLTDVVMPDKSGPEVVRELRQKLPELKVIYMSGYAEDRAQLQDAIREGAAFLAKPFSLSTMAAKVRQVLDGREGHVSP